MEIYEPEPDPVPVIHYMRELHLFEDSVHLERCWEDPDPYASESIVYTPYTILYKELYKANE